MILRIRKFWRSAAKVRDDGADELVAAVESGKVSVSAAATIAEVPKAEQAEIVAKGEREILQAAKEIRAARGEVRRAERIEKIVEISKGNPASHTPEQKAVCSRTHAGHGIKADRFCGLSD